MVFIKEWKARFSSPEAAARAVSALGGVVGSFCWHPVGSLTVSPLPGKEEQVISVLAREGIIAVPPS